MQKKNDKLALNMKHTHVEKRHEDKMDFALICEIHLTSRQHTTPISQSATLIIQMALFLEEQLSIYNNISHSLTMPIGIITYRLQRFPPLQMFLLLQPYTTLIDFLFQNKYSFSLFCNMDPKFVAKGDLNAKNSH